MCGRKIPDTEAKLDNGVDRISHKGKAKESQNRKGKERLQTKRQEAKRPAVAVKSSLTSLRMRLRPQSRMLGVLGLVGIGMKLGVLGLVGIGILRGVTGIAVPVGFGMNQAGTGSVGVGLGTVGVGMMGVVPGAGLTAGDHDRLHDVIIFHDPPQSLKRAWTAFHDPPQSRK